MTTNENGNGRGKIALLGTPWLLMTVKQCSDVQGSRLTMSQPDAADANKILFRPTG